MAATAEITATMVVALDGPTSDVPPRHFVLTFTQRRHEGQHDTAIDLTMAIDGSGAFEDPMPATPLYRDVVQLLAQSKTIQTPTLAAFFRFQSFLRRENPWKDPRVQRFYPPSGIAYQRERMERHATVYPAEPWYPPPDDRASVKNLASGAARIMAAGGCIGLGSHGNVAGLGPHYELEYLALGGMHIYDVLRAGTVCGAISIGHERDLGSLEVGKLADLQIVAMNPLDNIRNTRSIRFVMKGGRLFESNTLVMRSGLGSASLSSSGGDNDHTCMSFEQADQLPFRFRFDGGLPKRASAYFLPTFNIYARRASPVVTGPSRSAAM